MYLSFSALIDWVKGLDGKIFGWRLWHYGLIAALACQTDQEWNIFHLAWPFSVWKILKRCLWTFIHNRQHVQGRTAFSRPTYVNLSGPTYISSVMYFLENCLSGLYMYGGIIIYFRIICLFILCMVSFHRTTPMSLSASLKGKNSLCQ